VPSMASALLERHLARNGSKEEEQVVKEVAATSYAAGLETTSSGLNSFIFVVMFYPEVQKKAQLEITSVVGIHRLPTFEDRKALPYVEAVYREVMRCFPVTPLGLPHMTTEDDLYGDYIIPAGTTVLPNVWGMTHDEQIYPDPHVFKPERFLGSDGTLNEDSEILTFGFGRRICIGRHFADNTVWAAIASVLCALNISPPEAGADYPTDYLSHFTSSLFSHPKPFKCVIAPRDAAMSELIREESATA